MPLNVTMKNNDTDYFCTIRKDTDILFSILSYRYPLSIILFALLYASMPTSIGAQISTPTPPPIEQQLPNLDASTSSSVSLSPLERLAEELRYKPQPESDKTGLVQIPPVRPMTQITPLATDSMPPLAQSNSVSPPAPALTSVSVSDTPLPIIPSPITSRPQSVLKGSAPNQTAWHIQHAILPPPSQMRHHMTPARRIGASPVPPTYPAPPTSPLAQKQRTGSAAHHIYEVLPDHRLGYSTPYPSLQKNIAYPAHIRSADPTHRTSNLLIATPQPLALGAKATQIAQRVAIRNGTEADPLTPLIMMVRGGILRHDVALLGKKEEEGWDINLEILLRPFEFTKPIGAPQPIIGADYNLSGDTSQFYGGFYWQWEDIWIKNLFMGFSLGLAVHNGKQTRYDRADLDKGKELGFRLLFRESAEIGYRFQPNQTISLMFDHISNANMADSNEGLDNFGIRYGYEF